MICASNSKDTIMAEAQKRPERKTEITSEFVARVNKPSGKHNGLKGMKRKKQRANRLVK
jgi:hypothetical protein